MQVEAEEVTVEMAVCDLGQHYACFYVVHCTSVLQLSILTKVCYHKQIINKLLMFSVCLYSVKTVVCMLALTFPHALLHSGHPAFPSFSALCWLSELERLVVKNIESSLSCKMWRHLVSITSTVRN